MVFLVFALFISLVPACRSAPPGDLTDAGPAGADGKRVGEDDLVYTDNTAQLPDPEKDLVLVVKTPKQEIAATRVSRISASELHLQLQRGSEASVTFGEITEVSVRPRSAK